MAEDVDAVVAATYRTDWGRIVATLIRMTSDFNVAEEAAQEAFETAVTRWRSHGVPEHPRAWLIQTARHAAIDRLRRNKVLAAKLERHAEPPVTDPDQVGEIPDDRLRLVFTCCHPALALDAQVALTLRTLLGLETDEIARAFLVSPTTMAQRLVRAKHKIADARIPYVVPETSEMPERLHGVLTVIYLVFTEGYAATRGETMLRTDLSAEAIRLGRIVHGLLPAEKEVTGLLALMLLHDSRRDARVDDAGDVVVLDEQDRSLWDREEIAEALPFVDEAMSVAEPGAFALQAAIAAVHGRARKKEDTDWKEIVRLYAQLERIQPSPVIALNRAVAVAMVDGPAAALAILDELELDDYHLFHAARAELHRRIDDVDAAEQSYRRALELVGNDSERRFLERRLRELGVK